MHILVGRSIYIYHIYLTDFPQTKKHIEGFLEINIEFTLMLLFYNILCIPERFNTNISTQLLDYKITFVNLQH